MRARLFPIEVPHIGAPLAAGLAYDPRLNIGQPEIIRPVVGANVARMAASILGAIDKQIADERRRHMSAMGCDGGATDAADRLSVLESGPPPRL